MAGNDDSLSNDEEEEVVNDDPTIEGTLAELLARSPVEERFTLMLLEGIASGRTWSVRSGLRIGRDASCGITVVDKSVSRRHARFHRLTDGPWILEDLGSINGTFINGEAITAQAVNPGDHIRIGDGSTFRFSKSDQLETKLADAQRLEAVGRLAGGMAHDYNNLMMVVSANADLLREELEDDGPIDKDLSRELVDDICSATMRATRITRQLLDFARGGQDSITTFDLSLLCSDAVRMARMVLSDQIEIKLKSSSKVLIEGDEGRLSQVVLNLCVNAGDAMPNGGTLDIQVSQRTDENSTDVAIIQVTDNGTGMDEAILAHVFEPFFTTKPQGSGTGLGLAMSYGIIRRHGGTIDVQSQTGQGTTFTVELPTRAKLKLPHDMAAPTATKSYDIGGLVLIVDDNSLVRRASNRLLTKLGIRSIQAANGDQALKLCAQMKGQIQLILLDLSMPVLSGFDTLKALRESGNQTPVIVCTGITATESEVVRAAGGQGLLFKPYDAFALSMVIEEAGVAKAKA